jgi:hypothetical protein
MANDWTGQGFWTNEAPPSYKYTSIGSAAGTTTVCTAPAILHSIVVVGRAASGTLIMYDSVGTSGTVIGTLIIGTNTSNDPPPAYIFDAQCKNALSVSNSANTAIVVLSLP